MHWIHSKHIFFVFFLSVFLPAQANATSLNFNNGNYVQVTDSPSLDITEAITLESWVYKTWNGEDWNIIFSKPWTADSNPWHIYRLGITNVGDVPKNALCSLALEGGGAGVTGTSVIPDNEWVHIACTYDGSQLALYVNGILENSTPASGAILSNDQSLVIGRNLLNTWNDWFGRIDEVRVWNVARTQAEIQAAMNTRLAGSETGLAGYWSFEEVNGTTTATDSSPNGNDGTLISSPVRVEDVFAVCSPSPTGMTSWWGADNNGLDIIGSRDGTLNGDTAYVAGIVKEAFSFDGAGDYVSLPVSTDWDFGTDSFTINSWFKSGMSGSYGNIIRYHDGGGVAGFWGLRLNPGGYIEFFIADVTGFTNQSTITSSSMYNDNSWHFVTGVRDGGFLKLYVDGIEAATAVSDGGWDVIANAGTYPTIGGLGMSGIEFFNGLIDEVQIFDRALTLAEHQAISNAGSSGNCRPCEQQPSGAVSWWRGEKNGADSVGTNDGTLVNGVTFADGKVGRVLSFDGTNDYVVVNDVSFPSGNAVRTISLWAKTDQTGEYYLFSYGPNNTNQRFSLGVRNGYLYVENTGSGMSGDATVNDNEWHHLVAVWNGSALTLYVDGLIQVLTAPVAPLPGTLNTVLTGTANMGRVNGVDGYYFNGVVDEVIIYNTALSADQVAAIYTADTTGICGSCVDPASGMTNWWGGDGNAVDMVGTNDGTLFNGTTYDTGMVGQAFSFDGVDDYGDVGNVDLANKSFSFEVWIKRLTNNLGVIFSQGVASNYQGFQVGFRNATTFTFDVYGDNLDVPGSHDNTDWQHWAGTFDSTTKERKIYKDGELVENDVAAANYQGTGSMQLGQTTFAAGFDNFHGLVDELIFYDRVLAPEEVNAGYTAGSGGKCRSCANRPDGMVSWWQGEGDAVDFLGTDDGSLVNGTTFAAGLVGQAFSFDGTDDRVDFAATTGDFGADPFTVEFLLRFPASELSQPHNYLIGKSTPDSGQGWDIRLNGDTADGRLVVIGVNGWGFNIYSTNSLVADQWHHVALVGSASSVNLYVNGSLQGTSGRGTISTASNPFRIGMTTNYGGSPFEGQIDETAVYSTALTATEVANIANTRCAGKCASIDSTPDAFTFTDQTGVALSSVTTSDTITVSGIDYPASIAISSCTGTSCEYSINSGAFTGTAGTVMNGDSVQVRQTSSSSTAATTDLVLDIGGVTDTFSVTTLNQYTVTAGADGTGTGTVSSNVGGINYSYQADTTGTTSALDEGTNVVLTASATTGQSTVSWSDCAGAGGTPSGNGTESATCTFSSLSENETVTATFTLNTYTVTANAEGTGSGTVSSDVGGITYSYQAASTGTTTPLNHGAAIVLTASATTGQSTVSWSDCAGAGGTPSGNGTESATCTFSSLSENETVTATFTLNTYTVTANADGTGSGTVSSDVGGISYTYQAVSTGTTSALDYGSAITLTATADAGSTVSWSGCSTTGGSTTAATCTFSSLTQNETVTATFTLNTYAVTANAVGTGSGAVSSDVGGISYTYPGTSTETATGLNYGSSITLTAAADAGSTVSWSGCSSTGGTPATATCTISNLVANRAATATFTLDTFVLTVTLNGKGSGAVTSSPAGIDCGTDCSETYDYSTGVTLTPIPESGSKFVEWTGDADCWDGTVTMTQDVNCTANFSRFSWLMLMHILNGATK